MYYLLKNELYHHGILGQKWGVRRYQNEDGSLTEVGKKRYSNADILKARSIRDKYAEGLQNISNKMFESEEEARYKVWDKSENYDKYDDKYSEEFDKVFKKVKSIKILLNKKKKCGKILIKYWTDTHIPIYEKLHTLKLEKKRQLKY